MFDNRNGAITGAQTLDQAAHYKAQSQADVAGNQPRELRVLERIEGLSGGLSEMACRLELFINRLQNSPSEGETKQAALPPQGIMDNISTAEHRLRYCLELVSKINDAF